MSVLDSGSEGSGPRGADMVDRGAYLGQAWRPDELVEDSEVLDRAREILAELESR